MRTSPAGAAASKRCARLTVSPTTVYADCTSPASSPATTSPVLIPTRSASLTPCCRSRSSFSWAIAFCMGTAAPHRGQYLWPRATDRPQAEHLGLSAATPRRVLPSAGGMRLTLLMAQHRSSAQAGLRDAQQRGGEAAYRASGLGRDGYWLL